MYIHTCSLKYVYIYIHNTYYIGTQTYVEELHLILVATAREPWLRPVIQALRKPPVPNPASMAKETAKEPEKEATKDKEGEKSQASSDP